MLKNRLMLPLDQETLVKYLSPSFLAWSQSHMMMKQKKKLKLLNHQ